MRIVKTKDYNEMSKRAARMIGAQVILKPDSVLGLATGYSPLATYDNLIKMHRDEGLDFSQIKAVNLDEYKGLGKENRQSYYFFMKEKLFSHININMDNTYIPNGMASCDQAECKRYNEVIKKLGGIDFQLLGIGHNGHIAFNEPSDVFSKHSYLTALAKNTIEANSRLFDKFEDVPKFAYTMGVKSIFRARKILLLVSGEDKADILKEALFGDITPKVPASILQLHSDYTIIADQAALSKI